MSFCPDCRAFEGYWIEDEHGIEVCAECGAEGSRQDVPEHDDYNLER